MSQRASQSQGRSPLSDITSSVINRDAGQQGSPDSSGADRVPGFGEDDPLTQGEGEFEAPHDLFSHEKLVFPVISSTGISRPPECILAPSD